LALSSDIWPNHQCDLMWVNNTFLKERPDVVRAVMDSLLQGMKYVTQDFPDSAATVSKALGVQTNIGENSMKRQKFTHVLQRDNIADQYKLLSSLSIIKEAEIPGWDKLVDQGMYAYAGKRWESLAKTRV